MTALPEHRCKQQRILLLSGALLLTALGWLFTTVQAAEVERAVVKSRLEQMAVDIAAIRAAVEKATEKQRGGQ